MRRKKAHKYTVEVVRGLSGGRVYFYGRVFRDRRFLESMTASTEEDVLRKAREYLDLIIENDKYGRRTFTI